MEAKEATRRYSPFDIFVVVFLSAANAGVSVIAWALSAPGSGSTTSHSTFGALLVFANFIGIVGGLTLAIRGRGRVAVLPVVSVLPIVFTIVLTVSAIGAPEPPEPNEQTCEATCRANGYSFARLIKSGDHRVCECR
jgi:hypothetical protein